MIESKQSESLREDQLKLLQRTQGDSHGLPQRKYHVQWISRKNADVESDLLVRLSLRQ
ncbi:MAG: hypothetical protein ACRD44_06465 [Bryobacteraceae bacterium]